MFLLLFCVLPFLLFVLGFRSLAAFCLFACLTVWLLVCFPCFSSQKRNVPTLCASCAEHPRALACCVAVAFSIQAEEAKAT